MVICLELSAELHMAQLMPLPLTVSCFSRIQIGFTILVPAHLGSPGKRAVKCVCVCVCARAQPYHKETSQLAHKREATKYSSFPTVASHGIWLTGPQNLAKSCD